MYLLIPIPLKISTKKTTIIVNIMFMKAPFTTDIGIIIRGKYIFFIKSLFPIIDDELAVMAEEKNIHGTSATNRKI